MSVYISPNLTKKKTDYKPSDKITIYLNYYFQGKKLRIPSDVTVLFKDWDKSYSITVDEYLSTYKRLFPKSPIPATARTMVRTDVWKVEVREK